jgi:hypothetical protein
MFEIDFGVDGGGSVQFKTRQDFNTYVSAQLAAWQNVLAASLQNGDATFSNAILSPWNHVQSASMQHPSEEQAEQIKSAVYQMTSSRQLIFANELEGTYLSEVCRTLGTEGAKGALYIRNGQGVSQHGGIAFEGATLYTLLKLGLKSAAIKDIKNTHTATVKTLNDTTKTFSEELELKSADLAKITNEKVETFDTFLEQSNAQVVSLKSEFADAIKKANELTLDQSQKNETFLNLAKQEWDALTLTYSTHLGISAPVEYWKKKATIHKKNYANWKWTTGLGAFFGLLVLMFSIYELSNASTGLSLKVAETIKAFDPSYKIEAKDIVSHLWIMVGSSTLFAVTLFFWLVRFMIRMMMTEHHLAIDADARATMAETYLALTKVGETLKEERAIVLAALFKPVTDGLVRDDGMPAISPASVLASQLMK